MKPMSAMLGRQIEYSVAIVHESWGDIESWMIDGAEKVAAARPAISGRSPPQSP